MDFDKLTIDLYQENINWVYSIIKKLDSEGIERKETFIADPYIFNNMVVLGYYFMNLYVISNITQYSSEDGNRILMSIINGASKYNQHQLTKIYKENIDIEKIVDEYNTIVQKTKAYSPNDGLKARVVAVDEVYRRIYKEFNKRHFNVFVKVFMVTFTEFEKRIKDVIDNDLKGTELDEQQ